MIAAMFAPFAWSVARGNEAAHTVADEHLCATVAIERVSKLVPLEVDRVRTIELRCQVTIRPQEHLLAQSAGG